MPWTPNGKIDRKALPKPTALSPQAGEQLAPRDALELSVMQLWEGVLGLSGFGITARALVSRVNAVYGCNGH